MAEAKHPAPKPTAPDDNPDMKHVEIINRNVEQLNKDLEGYKVEDKARIMGEINRQVVVGNTVQGYPPIPPPLTIAPATKKAA